MEDDIYNPGRCLTSKTYSVPKKEKNKVIDGVECRFCFMCKKYLALEKFSIVNGRSNATGLPKKTMLGQCKACHKSYSRRRMRRINLLTRLKKKQSKSGET